MSATEKQKELAVRVVARMLKAEAEREELRSIVESFLCAVDARYERRTKARAEQWIKAHPPTRRDLPALDGGDEAAGAAAEQGGGK